MYYGISRNNIWWVQTVNIAKPLGCRTWHFFHNEDTFWNPWLTWVKFSTRGSNTLQHHLCNCNFCEKLKFHRLPSIFSATQQIVRKWEIWDFFRNKIFYVKTHQKCISVGGCCQLFFQNHLNTLLIYFLFCTTCDATRGEVLQYGRSSSGVVFQYGRSSRGVCVACGAEGFCTKKIDQKAKN